jgi:hypothetical protein
MNNPIGSTATYCPASLDDRRGVMNAAAKVLAAVISTDRATFALAK